MWLFAEADVLLAVGALPTDVPTDDYTVRQSMSATNIVVNIDTALLERSGALTQHVLDAPGAFAEAVADNEIRRVSAWAHWRAGARDAPARASTIPDYESLATTAPGTAHMTRVNGEIVARVPDDALYTFGADNRCFSAQAYLPTRVFPS